MLFSANHGAPGQSEEEQGHAVSALPLMSDFATEKAGDTYFQETRRERDGDLLSVSGTGSNTVNRAPKCAIKRTVESSGFETPRTHAL